MSDLDAIIKGEAEPVEEPQIEAPQEVEAEAPEVEAPVEEAPKAEPKEPETVPVSVVAELRQQLREMKALLPQPERPKAPDVLDDPEGYSGHLRNQVSEAVTGTKLQMSRFMAEREFGADVVKEAHAYFDAHPEQSHALLDHPSPFHAAVEFYNSQKVAQEIGNDPAGYAAKVEAELRKKIEAEMVAKQARDNAGKFAPSLANATGTGGSTKPTWNGPTSLDQLIG